MEETRRESRFVHRALILALVLSISLSPFFYHLVPFLLLPILIPMATIGIFVFFTGLTNFERKRMVILNIVLPIVIILLYEGYVYTAIKSGTHSDIHLNIIIWAVQVLVVNLLFILYHSLKILKIKKQEHIDYGGE